MISFRELVRRRSARRGVVVFAVATAALGSGVAYAAWTSSGAGTATTKAGTALAPVVAAGAVPATLLYPGGSATATVTVQNPNPYPVRVVSIAPNGSGCATFTTVSPGTALAAQSPATAISFTVSMPLDAANSCQGTTIDVPVLVTIASGT